MSRNKTYQRIYQGIKRRHGGRFLADVVLDLEAERDALQVERDDLQRRIDSHPDPDPEAGNFFSINGYAVECRNWYYKDGPGRDEQ